MNKKLIALIAGAVILFGAVIVMRWTNIGTAALWDASSGGAFLLPILAVSALIDSINPCAFSILLLTIAFLMSIGKTRRSIFAIGGSYIFGIFAIYLFIGLGIIGTLHIFNTPHFMAKVGALLLVAFGVVNVLGELFPSFPIRFKIPQAAHRSIGTFMERASLPGAFLVGVLVGLCEFPCTGGPYLMVLGLLHDSATYTTGFGYLVLYNLIFILPLGVILAIASNAAVVDRVRTWKKESTGSMHLWGGIAMVAIGVLMFFL